MKLAEALVQRADVTTRLAQLKQRALRNARHQEGEQTAEDPVELLTEYDRLAGELEALIRRINVTNLATEIEPGMTVTDGLALRDALRLRHRMLAELADAASSQLDRSPAPSCARSRRSTSGSCAGGPTSWPGSTGSLTPESSRSTGRLS